MKLAIWLSTLVVVNIANVLIGEMIGFLASTLIVHIVWVIIAEFLCRKWDAYQFYKNNPDKKGSRYSERLAQIPSFSEPLFKDSAEDEAKKGEN